MYAQRIKKGFHRVGLLLAGIFALGAGVAVVVSIYLAIEPLIYPQDVRVTLLDRTDAEFPPRTDLAKIEAAIRSHYSKGVDLTSTEKRDTLDEAVRRSMLAVYPQYRQSLLWREEV
jgi:hypothetical protein